MTNEVYGRIHHYSQSKATGLYHLDDEGEPLLGWYFDLVDVNDKILVGLTGPYCDAEEAEAAALKEKNIEGL